MADHNPPHWSLPTMGDYNPPNRFTADYNSPHMSLPIFRTPPPVIEASDIMASHDPPHTRPDTVFSSLSFIGISRPSFLTGPSSLPRTVNLATDSDHMRGGYATWDAPHTTVQPMGSRSKELQINNAILPLHLDDAIKLAGPWPVPNDSATSPEAQYRQQQSIRLHIAAKSGQQARSLMRETVSMENTMVHIHNLERNATLLLFRYAGQTPVQRQADLQLAEKYHQTALDHRNRTVSILNGLIQAVRQDRRPAVVNGGTRHYPDQDKAMEGNNFATPADVPGALLLYHQRPRLDREIFWRANFLDFMFSVFWHARGAMAISETFDPINNPEIYRYGEHRWCVHASLLYDHFVSLEMDNDALRWHSNPQCIDWTLKSPHGARRIEEALASFPEKYNAAVLQDPALGQRFVVNDISRASKSCMAGARRAPALPLTTRTSGSRSRLSTGRHRLTSKDR